MRFTNLLRDKRVFVTGGTRGLGRAFCLECAQHGAKVALNYSKDEQGAQETLQQIQKYGVEGLLYSVSVLEAEKIDTMVREIAQKWGGIDILINNAGITQPLPLALLEEEDWDRVMDINVKGTFLMTQALIKGMIYQKHGVILNIGSLAGTKMIEAPIHYSTSKAAIKGFSEALAKEVARYNIRVNCLAVGLLEEGVGQNLPEHRLKNFLENLALQRVGTVKEIAECAVFLVSDKNSYMNGATVRIDGGF